MNLNFIRRIVFTGVLSLFCNLYYSNAQGCVAIRGFSSCSGSLGTEGYLSSGEFLVGSNNRYFESFRHFRGTEQEENRIEEGTNVINDSYFFDLTLNYGVTDRLYANLLIPFVSHVRSSMYEHGGNSYGDRHTTRAAGLADLRIGGGYWLIDHGTKPFNFAFGAGIKLPTGDYSHTDTFYNQGQDKDTEVEAVVDQSIQPGDGGLGFNLDFQGYYTLSHNFMLTTSLYYLINPEETNGVLTRRGTSEFSVPDQYAAQIGTTFFPMVKGLAFYLGGLLEGVPASDFIGGSAGYRRPGYAISVDPGVNYTVNNLSLRLNVPFAVERNRIQSYEDKIRTIETGEFRQGDAAFADYLINFSLTYRITKHKTKKFDTDIQVLN
ncbi:Putative MetA-pathway of phenol degradation [Zhouia amylolytica]|uniref:Putative MetA-pathway of phenol degradation n=1 Tax=Zhouia amylolytica TaxID=376730 RepID=A0A1I6SDX1_9FLAO|nr:transporter [Zhouia amylolytica]SFS75127.1 Putative MetA-pathway of phenol degradation [Zhouia amylolytica]